MDSFQFGAIINRECSSIYLLMNTIDGHIPRSRAAGSLQVFHLSEMSRGPLECQIPSKVED
jgi:hypothetical protein